MEYPKVNNRSKTLTSSLMMVQTAPSASLQRRREGEVDAPVFCAIIQEDLSWLEKWDDRNLIKFNEGKSPAPWNECTSTHWELTGLTSSFAESTWGSWWTTDHEPEI